MSDVFAGLAILAMVLLLGALSGGPIARAASLRGYSFFRWSLISTVTGAPIALLLLGRRPNRRFSLLREQALRELDQELAQALPRQPASSAKVSLETIGDAQTRD